MRRIVYGGALSPPDRMDGSMTVPLRRLACALFISICLAALALPASAQEGQCCGALPEAVSAKRDAIAAAAARDDLVAMAALANPEDAFGFGDVEDIAQAWTGWKQQGTDMAAIARALLTLECSVYRLEGKGYYSWPAAVDLLASDLAKIAELNGGDFDAQYIEGPETGYYVGWRIIIEEDGRWTAFVAGD